MLHLQPPEDSDDEASRLAIVYQSRALQLAYMFTRRRDASGTERWLKIAEHYGRLHVQADAIDQLDTMREHEEWQKHQDYLARKQPSLP